MNVKTQRRRVHKIKRCSLLLLKMPFNLTIILVITESRWLERDSLRPGEKMGLSQKQSAREVTVSPGTPASFYFLFKLFQRARISLGSQESHKYNYRILLNSFTTLVSR